jgi:hypothetical protein
MHWLIADACVLLAVPQTQSFLQPWVCGTTGIPVSYTPYGRSWNVYDGTMGTTANAVFLANVYGQAIYSSVTAGYPEKGARYVCWARSQV